jgi:ribosomal protein L30E
MNLHRLTSLLFCLLSTFIFSQQAGRITLITDTKIYPVEIVNESGTVYVNANQFFKGLEFNTVINRKGLIAEYDSVIIEINNSIPFVKLTEMRANQSVTSQLIGIPFFRNENLFIPLREFVEIINLYTKKTVQFVSATRIRVTEKSDIVTIQKTSSPNRLLSLKINDDGEKTEIRILTERKIDNLFNFYKGKDLFVILWNVNTERDSNLIINYSDILTSLSVSNDKDYLQLKAKLGKEETVTEMMKGETENEIIVRISERDFGDWFTMESEHFKLIYRDSHSHLADYLLNAAERSYKILKNLFHFSPTEKIIINTYDVSDYGFAATTTVPQNYIRLEIEPLEPGYEVVPYNERYQWLISHELAHIIVNDMDSNVEDFFRSIFGKVNPDKSQPLTTFYSLFTVHNRYTPRWHQEAIAVFIETWLSGGFGRILGNFDEMYFRSRVADNFKFPTEAELEEIESHESVLLEHLFYMFGGRFISHLSIKFGYEKVIQWFDTDKNEFYPSYKTKFKNAFGKSFDEEWNDFIDKEIEFQKKNISILKSAPLSEIKPLTNKTFGWVGQPYYDKKNNSILFAYHKSGHLAAVGRFDLKEREISDVISLPSPSMIQVASTAFDQDYYNFFYTTNNNQLYRDIHLFDLNRNKHRELFKDVRTGHLTLAPKTHSIYGIQHSSGKAILVKSNYPYQILETITVFPLGDEIQQLAMNDDESLLAAIVHKVSGEQSLILIDIKKLTKGEGLEFLKISSDGTPENVSWSSDGKTLYWNAYTNGVSNIYCFNIDDGKVIPLSHTVKGLFRPIELSKDSLFAFEFSIDGFTPVIIHNKKVERLPAINYLGQNILTKSPQVTDWMINLNDYEIEKYKLSNEKTYRSLSNLHLQTFIPVITGFQDRKVLGIFAHITDPLMIQEFVIETGVSPFKEKNQKLRYHLRTKYSLKQKLTLAFDHNAPDFYDLFNKRKKAILGDRYAIAYSDYLIYDNPLKVKYNTDLSVYSGVRFINDNLLEIKVPDFAVFKTELDIRDLRKTIGSVDWEHGNQFRFNIIAYGSTPEAPEYAVGTYAEWDNYNLFLFDHNALHFKLSVGYHYTNPELLQGYFYFGGFGNREVENEPVKQFEKVFRFPGVPIYSIATDKFLKLMIANNLPPIRIPNIELLSQSLKNINISIYSQGLLVNNEISNQWVNVGAQINIMFNHWANLESTFSAGIAKAWWKDGNNWDWFLSYKLLKD